MIFASRTPYSILTRSKALCRSLKGKFGLGILGEGNGDWMLSDELDHDSNRLIIVHMIEGKEMGSFLVDTFDEV